MATQLQKALARSALIAAALRVAATDYYLEAADPAQYDDALRELHDYQLSREVQAYAALLNEKESG